LAVILDLVVVSCDIYAAFCVPDQKRDLYVSLPKDFTNNNMIWKLKKTLYGQADSPRQFYNHFSKTIMEGGYLLDLVMIHVYFTKEKIQQK
jgi:hypothetical protein